MKTTITTTLYRLGEVHFTPADHTPDGTDPRSFETLRSAARRWVHAHAHPADVPDLNRGDRRRMADFLVRAYRAEHPLPTLAQRQAEWASRRFEVV
jgi:hypothetical protein